MFQLISSKITALKVLFHNISCFCGVGIELELGPDDALTGCRDDNFSVVRAQ